jgi:beta-phosphoglucomutase
MKNMKAILFDFDGVLADTMQDNFQAWKKAFSDYGTEIQPDDYFPLEGMKLIHVAKTISLQYNINSKPEEIVKSKNKYYLEDHSFSFYQEVPEIIDFLKTEGKLVAIVSASPREKLERTVPKDFFNKFDVVISGDDTEKGKPHPEPYLTGIKKLNVKPEESLVIENAPLGIKSAKSAGAYCIAITTTLEKEYLRESNEVINSHRELFFRLKELSCG